VSLVYAIPYSTTQGSLFSTT